MARKSKRPGMGSHQLPNEGITNVWLTPPEIVKALGPFDLDPCASIGQPWRTAEKHFTINDGGFDQPWEGRVWLNPPYGRWSGAWLNKLATHGNGIALIFARTETAMFFREVWGRADALLFLERRLFFYRLNGVQAKHNAGAPSVVLAYGQNNVKALENSGLEGSLVTGWKVI